MTDFETIYRACFSDVYRYLLQLSGNESLAEELTGETFFKAMHSLKSFHGHCDVRVWLCQIGKNCYFSYLKKNRRFANMEDSDVLEIPADSPSIEETLVAKSDAMEIHRLLHELPEPYKEVFTLRIFGELSFSQIGKLFGRTENWACVTYHRARQKIRKRMEETQNEK